MENTEKVFFEDNDPHWYVALGERWAGPLAASEVYEKVLSQEITWTHFVWKPGQPGWTKICDTITFQAVVPKLPGVAAAPAPFSAAEPKTGQIAAPPQAQRKAPSAPSAPSEPPHEVRNWYLYYNDSQFGPFSPDEIERFLRVGRIHSRVHAWEGGMDNWERIERIAAFRDVLSELPQPVAPPAPKLPAGRPSATVSSIAPTAAASANAEKRAAPRRPLLAKILMTNGDDVTQAVCRDISVGGMQVLTDVVPGEVGATVRLNVSTSGQAAIAPFVAMGVIVRFLEDRRGFSFRFEKLSDDAQKAIESYIRSA